MKKQKKKIRINQGLILLVISIAGVIYCHLAGDIGTATLCYILFGFSLFRLNAYWEIRKSK